MLEVELVKRQRLRWEHQQGGGIYHNLPKMIRRKNHKGCSKEGIFHLLHQKNARTLDFFL